MSGPARSASCSVHTPLLCQAQVSNPPYPTPTPHHHNPLKLSLFSYQWRRLCPRLFSLGLELQTADSGKVTKCTGGLTFSGWDKTHIEALAPQDGDVSVETITQPLNLHKRWGLVFHRQKDGAVRRLWVDETKHPQSIPLWSQIIYCVVDYKISCLWDSMCLHILNSPIKDWIYWITIFLRPQELKQERKVRTSLAEYCVVLICLGNTLLHIKYGFLAICLIHTEPD